MHTDRVAHIHISMKFSSPSHHHFHTSLKEHPSQSNGPQNYLQKQLLWITRYWMFHLSLCFCQSKSSYQSLEWCGTHHWHSCPRQWWWCAPWERRRPLSEPPSPPWAERAGRSCAPGHHDPVTHEFANHSYLNQLDFKVCKKQYKNI